MVDIYYRKARSLKLERIEKPRTGCWIHLTSPTPEELQEVSENYQLDLDLLNDAIDPYESPRVEREDGAVYVFARYCQPERAGIATEPLLIIHHSDALITVSLYEAPILERLINEKIEVVTTQKTKLLLQILGQINMSYRNYMNKVSRHIFSVRVQLKKTDIISTRALIDLVDVEDDLNESLSALQPYEALLRNLLSGRFLRLYEEDKDLVEDLQLGTAEIIDLVKSRMKSLMNLRQAYDAIATNELNKVFRRLTSISIFLLIPTVVFSLYGMNVSLPFENDPNAFWYIMATVTAATVASILYFRRKRWV